MKPREWSVGPVLLPQCAPVEAETTPIAPCICGPWNSVTGEKSPSNSDANCNGTRPATTRRERGKVGSQDMASMPSFMSLERDFFSLRINYLAMHGCEMPETQWDTVCRIWKEHEEADVVNTRTRVRTQREGM